MKLAALAGGILSFVILAAGGGSPTDAAATPSVGPITTAVIVGTFSDSTTSVDMDAIKANFQGNPGHDVLSYFSETSYGKASIAPSFYGPYPLSTTSSIGCSSNSNQTLINVAAADIIYPQFSRLIFVYNCPGSDFGSATGVGPVSTPQGTVQAAQVALDANSAADLYSVVHELSHTLSNFLSHAGFYVCTPDAFIPPTRFDAGCISSEYGDAFDVLGGGPSHAVSQLNPFHKASAGWFGAGQFPTVSSPGTFTYTLAPYEQPTSGVLALNIPRGQSGTAWTVEYRQASGFDTWMASPTQCSGCTVTQGASIRLVTGGGGPGGGSDTQLIDTTPGTMTSSAYYSTSDGLDGALLPGRAFTDPEYGISIVAVSASASGLVVQVTIPAQTCVRGRPALSAPSPAAQTAGVGQIAIYSVTLTNNDSAGCAPNTFRYMPPSSATVRFVATPDFLSLAAGGTTTISLTASALPLTVAGSYGFSSADGSGAGIVRSNSIGMGDAIVSGLTFQLSATADATAPSAPSGLTANALGSNVVTLSWSPSTDNVGAIGYRVLRGAALFTTDTPSLVDAGVSAGTSYSYSVQAFDRRGNLSSATTVTVRPPAKIDFTAPTAAIVSATTGDHSLSVSWTASSDNVGIAYYRVYPCLVSSCLVPASVRSFAVEGLPTRTRYDLKVVAVDGDGNSSDPWVGAYTVYTAAGGDVAPPSQPQALVATAAVYGRVDLSWTASTDDAGVAGYDVYRNNRKIATATSTSYSDTLAGATSEYYVQAVDADGSLSAPSSRLWVSVPSSPSTTPTPGPLPSPTPSLAPTPTLSPAFTSTPSPAPTSTPSLAPTPTLSPAPTPTPTETPTATPTPVLSPSATDAPSPTPTPTATPTAAPAFTPTPTATPAPALAFPAGPLVQISQPSNGVVVPAGKTVVMLATASDDSGVAKVVFSVNGVSKCADNSAPYSCNWTVGTIQGTAYAITAAVVAKDGSAASQSFVVYGGLDTVSPVAQITFPADGDTVPAGKSVLLAVDAWDGAGVAKVEFYVNGARKCTDKAAPFTCGFSVGRGVDVSYRMYAIAYDFSGNSGVSQVITVTSR